MNALLTIKTIDQEIGFGIAFDAALQAKDWDPVPHIPFSYSRTFESTDINDVMENAKKDVKAAAREVDWKDVKYVIMTSNYNPFVYMIG